MAKLFPSPPAAAATTITTTTLLLFLLLLLHHHADAGETIHDVLRRNGLPAGLLPKAVKSFNLTGDGGLEVFLEGPCLAKYEDRVFFDAVVRANLTRGHLSDVSGFSQLELFVWLPVKDIVVSDPSSGLIFFDIVIAHKQLSLSLFEDPPDCKPPTLSLPHPSNSFPDLFSLFVLCRRHLLFSSQLGSARARLEIGSFRASLRAEPSPHHGQRAEPRLGLLAN